MTNSASTIILQYVCPCLGMLIANCMWLAPLRDLQEAVQRKTLAELNPTPWAVMLGNCYGWVFYGILQRNFWVYFANAPGILLSVWLNLGAVKLLYQEHHTTQMRASFIEYCDAEEKKKRRRSTALENSTTAILPPTTDKKQDGNGDNNITVPPQPILLSTTKDNFAKRLWDVTSQTTPAKTPHERLVLIIVALWMAISSIVGFAGSTDWIASTNWPSQSTHVAIVGYAVNLNLVFFYGAPLSTIWTVLQQRNTNSIHIPTLATNTLNGTFWLAYGLAITDWFIVVPNGLGALLGVVQVVLLVLFPRDKGNEEVENGGENEDNNAVVLPTDDDVIKVAVMETDDSSGDDPAQQQAQGLETTKEDDVEIAL